MKNDYALWEFVIACS